MPLTDEIKQVAEDLGKQLGADTYVQEYVRLEAQAQQDAGVASLEERYSQIYQNLLERQMKGEELEQTAVNEYYRLKREIQDHPLITARDNELVLVKALFAKTAQRLTNALGFEYSKFAE